MFIIKLFSMVSGKSKSQKGDTIVEVLASIAILGLALAGAYTLSNRSLQSGLDSAQRTAILNRAQGQVEFLRNAVANNSTSAYTSATQPFCINDTNGNILNGTACNFTGPAHTMIITYDSSTKIFKVEPTWVDSRNQASERAKLTLYYKLPEIF